MDDVDALTARDKAHRDELRRIGQAIGYGNAQSILGDLWDAMLDERYPSVDDVSRPGRGRMGVTVDDTPPPMQAVRAAERERGELRDRAERAEAKRDALRAECAVLAGLLRDCDLMLASIDDGDEADQVRGLRMALAYALDAYKRDGTLL